MTCILFLAAGRAARDVNNMGTHSNFIVFWGSLGVGQGPGEALATMPPNSKPEGIGFQRCGKPHNLAG